MFTPGSGKLEEENFDGIILAAAGLKRLGLLEQDTYEYTFLAPEEFAYQQEARD